MIIMTWLVFVLVVFGIFASVIAIGFLNQEMISQAVSECNESCVFRGFEYYDVKTSGPYAFMCWCEDGGRSFLIHGD